AESKRFNETRARTVIKNLQKRNLNGIYVADRKEAISAVLDMIPPDVSISRGNSVTLFQLDIMSELIKRNRNTIIDPFPKDFDEISDFQQTVEMARQALTCDVFLTSTNAITIDGKLVNIDGQGNRVAAMIFGPRKVIVIAGVNKIVPDVEAALNRIHSIATPTTAIWHELKHNDPNVANVPCAQTGKCTDCNSEWRGCRYTVIIEGAMPPQKDRINVVLVGEELGI
ncbi:MAG: lactate utilization protein, partial [Dehalococcoidia bacterium]